MKKNEKNVFLPTFFLKLKTYILIKTSTADVSCYFLFVFLFPAEKIDLQIYRQLLIIAVITAENKDGTELWQSTALLSERNIWLFRLHNLKTFTLVLWATHTVFSGFIQLCIKVSPDWLWRHSRDHSTFYKSVCQNMSHLCSLLAQRAIAMTTMRKPVQGKVCLH